METVSAVNILLVDDREDNLMALNAVLRSPEYNLVNATSGEQALALLKERDFAVVLMDVQMPGMGGLEAARHMRTLERTKSTPIILVTGMFPDEEHIRLGYEVGAVDFISKPFDPRVMKSKVAVFVDLFRKTEKIRAQEKLLSEASESRFRTIFEQSPLAIQLFSPEGECVEVNGAWEKLWGDQAPTDAARRPPLLSEAIRKARDGTPSALPASRLLNRWVEFFVYPVRNDSGAIREVAVILRDMTDSKEMEEELRKSRDQLRVIFERVADGIVVQDFEGRCVYVNDVGAKLFGATTGAALVGKDFRELIAGFDVFDQDGQVVSESRFPARLHPGATNRSSGIVLRLHDRVSSRDLWTVVSSRSILDDAGQPFLLVSIYRDITEQRRTEDNERFLADATAAMAASLDYRATIQHVAALTVPMLADAFCLLLPDDLGVLRAVSIDAPESSLGLAVRQLLHGVNEGEAPPCSGIATSVFESGEPAMLNHIDGSQLKRISTDPECHRAILEARIRAMLLVPVFSRDRVLGVIGLFARHPRRAYDTVDLSLAEELGRRAGMAIENSRLYAEAQSQREGLQKAVLARDEFISIASHELKTPVTSLILHSEMLALQLEREPLQDMRDRFRRFVDISGSQIDRLSRLIDEMLDVSRISNGQLAMEMETIDLTRLAKGVTEDFSEQLAETGTSASFEGGPVVLVRCDRYRIEQVVTNLLTNAMKYGNGKPISVRVEQAESSEGPCAKLIVKDSGIGIAEEHHERIFGRFERAVSPDTIGGLGLGLYIVRQIIESHGGTVRVQSRLGEGAAFIVTLPLASG